MFDNGWIPGQSEPSIWYIPGQVVTVLYCIQSEEVDMWNERIFKEDMGMVLKGI